MTGLLVSVRDAEEAELALAGGADLIDVKEPLRGALGPADPKVWRQIQQVVAGRRPTSAALGELLDDEVQQLARRAAGFSFAKIGLAGCHDADGWIDRWFRATSALPGDVHPVPVAYADWPTARAPSPSVALALAALSPARLLLVDTFDKTHGTLLAHLPFDSLSELCEAAQAQGVRLVLAGSLDAAAIAELLPLGPAWFGVRGAACRASRAGTIDSALVKTLAGRIHRGVLRPK
jgi:(5-formylfuran-3-yl)methyl phosphate synthase